MSEINNSSVALTMFKRAVYKHGEGAGRGGEARVGERTRARPTHSVMILGRAVNACRSIGGVPTYPGDANKSTAARMPGIIRRLTQCAAACDEKKKETIARARAHTHIRTWKLSERGNDCECSNNHICIETHKSIYNLHLHRIKSLTRRINPPLGAPGTLLRPTAVVVVVVVVIMYTVKRLEVKQLSRYISAFSFQILAS